MIVTKIKKVLPPAMLANGKAVAYRLKLTALKTVCQSRFLCSIYYCFFSPAFLREQHAVVSGLVKYLDSNDEFSSFYLLRRNIHRLEKGLLMRPRRDVFALDYIGETVACYIRCAQSTHCNSNEEYLRWAHDVLTHYFEAVSKDTIVETAYKKFEAAEKFLHNGTARVPYNRQPDNSGISYNQLLTLAKTRKSVRWFLDKAVPRELIEQSLDVATLAPSACNRQPFRYCVFDDPEMVKKVASIPLGTVGFCHNIPTIAVVVGDLSAYFGERDRHGIYVDASLSIMLFELALETLGLASCSLNWPDVAALEKKMGKLLQLKPHERVVMSVAIGYPDPEGQVAYSQKKTGKQLCSFNVPKI